MKKYIISKAQKITETEVFSEASREELRALVVMMESDTGVSKSELAAKAGISEARAASAIALFESAGIIAASADFPDIEREFPENPLGNDIEDISADEAANTIRDGELSSMIAECAALMNKAVLPTSDVKRLAALYSQYALGEEYIATLAAYLASKDKLTVTRLVKEAVKLVEKGVDSSAELEIYIKNKESVTSSEYELRRLFGIYDRALTKSESEYFRKWTVDMAFGLGIISEAYNIAVDNTGKPAKAYMDKLLTHWHESGCKTAEDCIARVEADRLKRNQSAQPKAQTAKKDRQKPKMRYGEFDINDAFAKALERSYGTDGGDK